jgi:hypothetical protein
MTVIVSTISETQILEWFGQMKGPLVDIFESELKPTIRQFLELQYLLDTLALLLTRLSAVDCGFVLKYASQILESESHRASYVALLQVCAKRDLISPTETIAELDHFSGMTDCLAEFRANVICHPCGPDSLAGLFETALTATHAASLINGCFSIALSLSKSGGVSVASVILQLPPSLVFKPLFTVCVPDCRQDCLRFCSELVEICQDQSDFLTKYVLPAWDDFVSRDLHLM